MLYLWVENEVRMQSNVISSPNFSHELRFNFHMELLFEHMV